MMAWLGTYMRRLLDRLMKRTPTGAAKNLDCRDVVVLVTDYLEAQLQPELQRAFEEHIAGCVGCNNYVEQMQRTIEMLRTLTQEPMFPETQEELLHIFRTWKRDEMPEQW
ncbi:MAG: zf-HC2 domain-containing protein [Chloroflexi bacterium]|nr:zf-HC2 domain-containing protein [Chloroflexota bacterium]